MTAAPTSLFTQFTFQQRVYRDFIVFFNVINMLWFEILFILLLFSMNSLFKYFIG